MSAYFPAERGFVALEETTFGVPKKLRLVLFRDVDVKVLSDGELTHQLT